MSRTSLEFFAGPTLRRASVQPFIFSRTRELLSLQRQPDALPYWPMAAMDAAAEFGGKFPGISLADEAIRIEALSNHTAIQALGEIINASLLSPTIARALPGPHFGRGKYPMEVCSTAEPGFATTHLSALNGAKPEYGKNSGFQIVVDEDGAAVFLRKAFNFVHTAISLRKFYAGELPYPAGTIVSLGLRPNLTELLGQERLVADTSDVLYVDPLRLSMYALRPDERPNGWATKHVADYTYLAEAEDFANLTIERMGDTATQAAHALTSGQIAA